MKKFLFILFLFSILKAEESFERFISSSVFYNGKNREYFLVLENNEITRFFVESKDWVDENIKGYGGDINLQIYFSLDGKIQKIKVIEQYETEMYAKNVFTERYLRQYYGKNADAEFILGKDIHSITGATISCSAVNEIIYQCVKNVNQCLIKKDIIKKTSFRLSKIEVVKTIVLVILFLIAIFGFIYNIKILRYIIMCVSVIFLGVMYYGGLSFNHIQNFVYLNSPHKSNIFIWSLIVLTILTTLLIGRLYCGWLCPFGAVTEFLFEIKKFFETRYKKSLGKEIEIEIVEDNVVAKFLRKYEYLYKYAKYIFAVLILFYPKFIFFEPFQHMFLINKTSLKGIIYLIFVLIFCLLFVRLWCRYFCPLGGVLSLFSKISLFRLKINTLKCFNCEICKIICPTNAIIEKNDKLKILYTECILCNKCRQSCGPKNINISYLKLK
jgi:NosR/NirI family nitrous oxide reductase transcriptional regulator